MPVLKFWGYSGVWVESFVIALLGFGLSWLINFDEDEAIVCLYRSIPLIIIVSVGIIATCQSCEAFHADKYAKRLPVTEMADSVFNNDVAVLNVKKLVSVDESLAQKVAEDILGEDTGLGSKVRIGKMTIQQISGSFTIGNGKQLSFDDDLIWVAPLEHRSFWKWASNKTTPGYVIVDATDINRRWLVTTLNGRDLNLRYVESAFFNDDLERHIRVNGFLRTGLNDHAFEIDADGNPYWVLSSYKKTIGFGGEESEGPILVHAETGEISSYSIEDAPAWVDRIWPKDFIQEQIRQWGEYQKGYWNSTWLSKQEGVLIPTIGMSIVYSNGRSYWYTGICSIGADNATNGFMLVDTRTKAAKFYRKSGFNETEARNIACGQPEAAAAKYTATFPVLYNVRGIPTYFMTYKDSFGNIQGYCFVSSVNRQAIGCGKLKTVAIQNYLAALQAGFNDHPQDSEIKNETLTTTIRGITLEGEIYYILLSSEKTRGYEFTGRSINFPELKWSHEGDHVEVSFAIGEEKVVPLDSFDNLDFQI